MDKLRLVASTDVDATPLVDGLDRPPWSARAELTRLPGHDALAQALDEGAADAALIPVDALAHRAAELEIVPGIAVGADRVSPLVQLLHRVPLADVRTIGIAARGHAAAMLVRLLFRESGRDPELHEWRPDRARETKGLDALLVTGDEALTCHVGRGMERLDLAEAWAELTTLPFVWSVWAARPASIDRARYGLLHGVRSRGRHRLPQIAESFARRRAIDAAEVSARLSTVTYRLGRRQLDGIRAFWSRAADAGLLPAAPAPRFVPLSASRTCHELAEKIARSRRTY